MIKTKELLPKLIFVCKSVLLFTVLLVSLGTTTQVYALDSVADQTLQADKLSKGDCAEEAGFDDLNRGDVGPCRTQKDGLDILVYQCEVTGGLSTGSVPRFVNCKTALGSDDFAKTASCFDFYNGLGLNGNGLKIKDAVKTDAELKTFCKKQFNQFCGYQKDSSGPFNGKSNEFCFKSDQLDLNKSDVIGVSTNAVGEKTVSTCVKPSPQDLTKLKAEKPNSNYKEEKLCLTTSNGAIYQCEVIDLTTTRGEKCIEVNAAAQSTNVISDVGVGTKASVGEKAGDIFSIIYKVLGLCLLAFALIVGILEMVVLFLLSVVTGTLMNLSPTTPFLTNIGIPISSIFNNLANLVMGFLFILLGSQSMLGLQKTENTVSSLIKLASFALISNFVYLVLAFIISLFDGFAQLIIRVFAGGDILKLFWGLMTQFTAISDIRSDGSLFPSFSAVGEKTVDIFQSPVGYVTELVLQEALVVAMLFVLILVFKRVFILVLTRATILFLFLVASPLIALAFLAQDLLPQSARDILKTIPSQIFYSLIFNLVFVSTMVLVFTITRQVQTSFNEALATSGTIGQSGMLNIPGISSVNAYAADGGIEAGAYKLINIAISLVPFALALSLLNGVAKFFEDTIPEAITKGVNSVIDSGNGLASSFIKASGPREGFANLARNAYSSATSIATGGGGRLEQSLKNAGGVALKSGNLAINTPGAAIGLGGSAVGGAASLLSGVRNLPDTLRARDNRILAGRSTRAAEGAQTNYDRQLNRLRTENNPEVVAMDNLTGALEANNRLLETANTREQEATSDLNAWGRSKGFYNDETGNFTVNRANMNATDQAQYDQFQGRINVARTSRLRYENQGAILQTQLDTATQNVNNNTPLGAIQTQIDNYTQEAQAQTTTANTRVTRANTRTTAANNFVAPVTGTAARVGGVLSTTAGSRPDKIMPGIFNNIENNQTAERPRLERARTNLQNNVNDITAQLTQQGSTLSDYERTQLNVQRNNLLSQIQDLEIRIDKA